jgi:hypothetical protein
MKILIDIRHVRWQNSIGYDGRPSEWVELHWNGPRAGLYWLVDQRCLRMRGVGGKFIISNTVIDHYAAVTHKTWCTLLIFGSVRLRLGRLPGVVNRIVPKDTQLPTYSELGTTFNPNAAKTMIEGIKALELKFIEFEWPEFLEHTYRCRAMRLRESATISVAEHELSSVAR